MALSAIAAPALAQEPKWGPHVDFEVKPGTKRALGEADLFIPVAQDAATLLFANLRFRVDDDSGSEGNYGLGLRHMLESGWNLGAYGYFDRRRTEYDNHFNQVTVGVEALSQDWDLRANYYAPVGSRMHNVDSLNSAEIVGTSVFVRGGEERSMGGFDAEIGWRVPVFEASADRQFRIFGGGYHFSESGVPDIEGPRVRAEMTFDSVPGLWEGSRLSLGAEWQHDDPRSSQGFLTARLRIPLQVYGKPSSKLTPMERRMADPVVRDIDVVSQAGPFGPAQQATHTADGSPITVVSSASTSGANLPTVVTNAGANSTVIVQGTFNTTGTIVLNNGQTLIGGGQILVGGGNGISKSGTLTLSGGTINGGITASSGVIQMTTNSIISGLTVSNTVASAFDVNGVTIASGSNNVIIRDSSIRSTVTTSGTANGIYTSGATNIVINNSSLTAITTSTQTSNALNIDAGSSTSLTVKNTSLSASGGLTNNHTRLVDSTGTITIQSGSTNNTIVNGGSTCSTGGVSITGHLAYTNGTTCP